MGRVGELGFDSVWLVGWEGGWGGFEKVSAGLGSVVVWLGWAGHVYFGWVWLFWVGYGSLGHLRVDIT